MCQTDEGPNIFSPHLAEVNLVSKDSILNEAGATKNKPAKFYTPQSQMLSGACSIYLQNWVLLVVCM